MKVSKQLAYGMGYKQSDGGEYRGETYSAYTVGKYLIHGEDTVRSMYLDSLTPELRNDIRGFCEIWGKPFLVSGELNAKGKFEIREVAPVSRGAVDFDVADFVEDEGV